MSRTEPTSSFLRLSLRSSITPSLRLKRSHIRSAPLQIQQQHSHTSLVRSLPCPPSLSPPSPSNQTPPSRLAHPPTDSVVHATLHNIPAAMSSRPKRKVKLSSKGAHPSPLLDLAKRAVLTVRSPFRAAADAVRVAADALGGVSDVPTRACFCFPFLEASVVHLRRPSLALARKSPALRVRKVQTFSRSSRGEMLPVFSARFETCVFQRLTDLASSCTRRNSPPSP